MIKVSVCIPTFNQALYIEKAVKSVAKQTFPPYEIIVSDDASTDKTPEILKPLSTEIPILKVIRQPINLGISRNVDACLRSALGDIVIRLDSDDFLLPTFIEKLVPYLQKFPDAGYVHAAVMEIDQYDNPVKERRLIRSSGYQSDKEALKAAVNGYRVAANIIVFRREALEKAGYIRAKANFAEDYYLCASISAQGYGNYYLNEILSSYRVWIDTAKVRQKRKLAEIIGLRQVFEEVLEPAFQENNYDLGSIKKKRSDFACMHADCLGWEEYTASEKEELVQALSTLSDSKKAKAIRWLYLNGYGKILGKILETLNLPKKIIRSFILRIKK